MAKDPRKRQKKLQRQKAKDKARKRALAERTSTDLAVRLQRAADAPFLHCCATSDLFDRGMSNVLISREVGGGDVAFASFLIDMYCLGVKDVFLGVTTRQDYEWQVFATMSREYEIVNLEPAAARKLIEGAVQFAADAGLQPHRDYRKAKRIFGDIDPAACTEEFTYGKQGRHFFFAGPHDSPTRCRQIIETLTKRCGPDGFDYMMASSEPDFIPAGGNVYALEDFDDDGEWAEQHE